MTADELLERMGPGDIELYFEPRMPRGSLMPLPSKPTTLLLGADAYEQLRRSFQAVDALLTRVFPRDKRAK